MSSGPPGGAGPPSNARLHHIGFVVPSIRNSGQSFAESLGSTWDGSIVHDPLQMVRVTFLRGRSPADPLIELVEPDGPLSPAAGCLRRGGGLHHLCYEVEDLDLRLRAYEAMLAKVVRLPAPAVAFGGRRIAWVVTKDKLLLEFLER